MRKRFFGSTFCAMLFALCFPPEAQQPAKIPRIGYVSVSGSPYNPGRLVEAFRQGLRDLGYDEGKNIVVEYRWAAVEPERVSAFVAELVQLKVDVLVSSSAAAIRAAKQPTRTIPIVMMASFDPVEAGMVESMAHPGGNITGVTRFGHELSGKRLELFKEAVPGISRVGVLAAEGGGALKEYEAAARAQKIAFESLEVRGPNPDLDGIFQAAIKGRVNGLITQGNVYINRYQKQIVELALKNRLPSMFTGSSWVQIGGLLSYSSDEVENFKRAATYVGKILKGAKPADLPVEQPMKFEFVINLKTAKALDLTIPQSVLYRADKVFKESAGIKPAWSSG